MRLYDVKNFQCTNCFFKRAALDVNNTDPCRPCNLWIQELKYFCKNELDITFSTVNKEKSEFFPETDISIPDYKMRTLVMINNGHIIWECEPDDHMLDCFKDFIQYWLLFKTEQKIASGYY